MRPLLVMMLAGLAVGCGTAGTEADVGGDAEPIDTMQHPDVPPVLPDEACDGNTPAVTFSHGFEPGERLPDDPGYYGFEVVSGGACPDAQGGTRSLAWSGQDLEGAYASLPDLDLPATGTSWLSFCLVLHGHAGDLAWIDVIAGGADPETVWSTTVGADATDAPTLITASLAPFAGQRIHFSIHFSRGDELADPARDVRIDGLTLYTCPNE